MKKVSSIAYSMILVHRNMNDEDYVKHASTVLALVRRYIKEPEVEIEAIIAEAVDRLSKLSPEKQMEYVFVVMDLYEEYVFKSCTTYYNGGENFKRFYNSYYAPK